MSVDYNIFAKKFAHSRKDMKWEEVEYFFSLIQKDASILDVACGSGRLLEHYTKYFGSSPKKYIGVDISQELLNYAQESYPEHIFLQGNMCDLSTLVEKNVFENIFCIAGFHHLETLEERIQTLQDWYSLLPVGGKVFMTNWALESSQNTEKYQLYRKDTPESRFGSSEYMIPFGEHLRYYHCFTLNELEYIALQSGWKLLENRLFENEKNYITILQK